MYGRGSCFARYEINLLSNFHVIQFLVLGGVIFGTMKGCKRKQTNGANNLGMTDCKYCNLFCVLFIITSVRRDNINRLQDSRISIDSEADTNGKFIFYYHFF